MYEEIPKDRWAEALEEFTERNAQRLTAIEIDDPEFGAQEQERDIPLRGVSYDRRDDRISIMLGELEGVEPHLTHSIANANSLSIGPERSAEVIRIAHNGAQTLVWVRLEH